MQSGVIFMQFVVGDGRLNDLRICFIGSDTVTNPLLERRFCAPILRFDSYKTDMEWLFGGLWETNAIFLAKETA